MRCIPAVSLPTKQHRSNCDDDTLFRPYFGNEPVDFLARFLADRGKSGLLQSPDPESRDLGRIFHPEIPGLRKTAAVFSVFSMSPILNERCEGCDLVAGATSTAEASLIDTEKVFHGWEDSLQDGAFLQLVTDAR